MRIGDKQVDELKDNIVNAALLLRRAILCKKSDRRKEKQSFLQLNFDRSRVAKTVGR